MKCQVLIDWLTFSVKETDPNKVIQTYLGMDPALFQDTGYSLMGYNKVIRFSDILVCSEGREDDYFKDMGVCVSMSGNGCWLQMWTPTSPALISPVTTVRGIWTWTPSSPKPRRTR